MSDHHLSPLQRAAAKVRWTQHTLSLIGAQGHVDFKFERGSFDRALVSLIEAAQLLEGPHPVAPLSSDQRESLKRIRDALVDARRMGVASVVMDKVDEAISDARALINSAFSQAPEQSDAPPAGVPAPLSQNDLIEIGRAFDIHPDAALAYAEEILKRTAPAAVPAEFNPDGCDSKVYADGELVGVFGGISKEDANTLCAGIRAITGARVDWHYFGGRVVVKALPADVAPAVHALAHALADASNAATGQGLTDGDEREKFESVFCGLDFTSHTNGEYLNPYVEHMWEGWNRRALLAAPAAPAPTNQQISDYLNGLDAIQREVAEREARAAAPAPAAQAPDFDAIRDKRMSELTPAEQDDALELWLREQIGWFTEDTKRHLQFLLSRIDALRSAPATDWSARAMEAELRLSEQQSAAYVQIGWISQQHGENKYLSLSENPDDPSDSAYRWGAAYARHSVPTSLEHRTSMTARGALQRLEVAVDWFLGRSGFTQSENLKGVAHSNRVRKELFAAHDHARFVLSTDAADKPAPRIAAGRFRRDEVSGWVMLPRGSSGGEILYHEDGWPHALATSGAEAAYVEQSKPSRVDCGNCPAISTGCEAGKCLNKAEEPPKESTYRTLGERIDHVGGRTNAAGYVEFGSPMAVDALVRQAIDDANPLQKGARERIRVTAILVDSLARRCDGVVERDIVAHLYDASITLRKEILRRPLSSRDAKNG